LFKKVVIADTFSVIATNGFDLAESLNIFEAWITSLSYTFQLYFDFSGYTDMAIGCALLFNIRLPINFNSPYKATDIRDFWRRWHITLSRFLRDYIYIPLGGNRLGSLVLYRNLMVTFFIGGVWHGAGWTFIAWGALHGVAMVLHALWSSAGMMMNRFVAWFVTFNFINISWVFFRAKDFDSVKKVLGGMVTGELVLDYHFRENLEFLHNENIVYGAWLQNIHAENKVVLYLVFALVAVTLWKNSNALAKDARYSKWLAFGASLLFLSALLNMNTVSEFLYFNF
jgi:D-alanyl-lipoteichoic acid acyltransferase DltB (MBOAT superfamily)